MRLWIENIAPGTDDEEIKSLVKKYAPELTCVGIVRVDAAGSRPGALLRFGGGVIISLDNACRRLSGMHWKGRALVCCKIGIFER